MTSNEALNELEKINARQNNGNGDIWLETTIIQPIKNDLEILKILKKYLEIDYDEDNNINEWGFSGIDLQNLNAEELEKVLKWIEE